MFATRICLTLLLISLVCPAFAAPYRDPNGRFTLSSDIETPLPGETPAPPEPTSPEEPAPASDQTQGNDLPALEGLKAMDGPTGGHMLYGALAGVTYAAETFKAGLHRARTYFGTSFKLLSAVRSKDGDVMIVSYSANLHNEPVGGLGISTYDPVGGARFALLFDEPARLSKSLPAMLKRFKGVAQEAMKRLRPAVANPSTDFARFEADSHKLQLIRTPFNDGTASIGLAPGFTPQEMSGGRFSASAKDGAYIVLFSPSHMLDTHGTLYQQAQQLARMSGGGPLNLPGYTICDYTADPVQAWKNFLTESTRLSGQPDPSPQILHSDLMPHGAPGVTGRFISGTITLHGEPFVFTGNLIVGPPSPMGGWLLQRTILCAPAVHAATDMPALIAMQQSEKVDLNAVRDQTMRNMEVLSSLSANWLRSNKAAFDQEQDARFHRSMDHAQAVQDSIDNSAAGFIQYINGTTIVQNNATGEHVTSEQDLASALAKSDPKQFSEVPVSQFVKGRDY